MLQLHRNLGQLRKERGITQEELAQFIGVTKASVSKWETGQSFPDILLLPQLATYFGTSIDALLGYEPQLSSEQIQKLYQSLATDFSEKAYDVVMAQSESLVKKYYACGPFLLQIAILWLNHLELAPTVEEQQQRLQRIRELCQQILTHEADLQVSHDAVIITAVVDLQLGKAEEVIETLEPLLNPYHFSKQSEAVLIQAYQLAGKLEQAQKFNQMAMYQHLLLLVSSATVDLQLNWENKDRMAATVARIDGLLALYEIQKLHPNTAAIYQYQVAIVYAMHQQESQALERLSLYVQAIEQLFDDGVLMHGDDYFDRLATWFEEAPLGATAIRNPKLVLASSLQAFTHPAFAMLQTHPTFQLLKLKLQKRGEIK